jgi:hypothetical protein
MVLLLRGLRTQAFAGSFQSSSADSSDPQSAQTGATAVEQPRPAERGDSPAQDDGLGSRAARLSASITGLPELKTGPFPLFSIPR